MLQQGNDIVKAWVDSQVTGSGDINSQIKKFLEAETSETGTLTDLWMKWCIVKGIDTGTVQDRINTVFKILGYSPGTRLTPEELAAVMGTRLFIPYDGDIEPSIGIAAPTFARATTATVEDHEGVIREVLSGEARLQGQRRVHNEVTGSADLSDAAWVKDTFSIDGEEVTYSSGAGNIYQLVTVKAGQDRVLSFSAKRGTATTALWAIYDHTNAAWIVTGASYYTKINSDTYTRICLDYTVPANCTQVRVYPVRTTITGTMFVKDLQDQDKTGASDPTIPDDYVSTGVGVGSELVTNGTFDSSVDSWTASVGTIEWAAGAMQVNVTASAVPFGYQSFATIIGKPYVLKGTATATTAGTPRIYVGNSIGNSSLGNLALTIGEEGSASFIATATTTFISCRVDSAVNGNHTEFDNISVKSLSHGSNVDGVKVFLTDNGNTVASNVVTEAVGSAITGEIGYFGEIASTNNLLYSRDCTDAAWTKTNITAALDAEGIDGLANGASSLTATAASGTCFQTITLTSAARTFSIYVKRKTGTGTLEYTDDGGSTYTDITSSINSSTYTRFDITKTQANPSVGFRITTDTDAIEVDGGQVEDGGFATSIIQTTTAAVTRNAAALYYPTTNIPVNDCVFSFDWTPTAVVQGNVGLFGLGASVNDRLVVYVGSSSILVRKDVAATTHESSTSFTYTAGTKYTFKVRMSSVSGSDIWVDDVKGSNDSNTTDHDTTAPLWIGSSTSNALIQTGGINNFKVHSGSFTDAGVEAL